jgi:hypothetical protein
VLSGLRYPRFWWVCGWISVAAAMFLSLVPMAVMELPGWNDKLEHACGYFLLTFWFCGIYPRHRYWVVGLAMFGMGIVVELLQGAMHLGRHADVKDLVADIIGIAPALLLAQTPLRCWPRWLESWLIRA